ncbi:MAG: hypothetical protein OXQ29_03175 [Rhodospirillaceae bacterium]|nr:hypothetical protein [Rhodospirillaceae bacterium]
MKPHPAIRRRAALTALLCGGAIVPVAGWTHWEGYEAADPSTPAALLMFESAAAGYVEVAVTPGFWLARFELDGQSEVPGQPPAAATGEGDAVDTGEHSGRSGVEPPAPASASE